MIASRTRQLVCVGGAADGRRVDVGADRPVVEVPCIRRSDDPVALVDRVLYRVAELRFGEDPRVVEILLPATARQPTITELLLTLVQGYRS